MENAWDFRDPGSKVAYCCSLVSRSGYSMLDTQYFYWALQKLNYGII
jgi:hypothetical protein